MDKYQFARIPFNSFNEYFLSNFPCMSDALLGGYSYDFWLQGSEILSMSVYILEKLGVALAKPNTSSKCH